MKKAFVAVITTLTWSICLFTVSTLPAAAYEFLSIPNSAIHSPDGTWWGHNQLKVADGENYTYFYIIENDNDPETFSQLRLYAVDAVGTITAGAAVHAASGGNIILDNSGQLHLFVLQSEDPDSHSIGNIIHYTFQNAATGDITNYVSEIAVNSDLYNINQRFTVGYDTVSNTVYVVYGDSYSPQVGEHMMIIHYMDLDYWSPYARPDPTVWNAEFVDSLMDTDYYYPYFVTNGTRRAIVAEQDEFVGEGQENKYQKIRVFINDGSGWNNETIVDLSSNPIAATRARLLEVNDVSIDQDNTVHIYYKEFLGQNSGTPTATKYVTVDPQGTVHHNEFLAAYQNGAFINWMRHFSLNGDNYFATVTYDRMYIADLESETFSEIPEVHNSTNPSIVNTYPYTGFRSQNSANKNRASILLLSAASNSFPDAPNRLVRFSENEVQNILLPIPVPEIEIEEDVPEIVIEPVPGRRTSTGSALGKSTLQQKKAACNTPFSVFLKKHSDFITNTSEVHLWQEFFNKYYNQQLDTDGLIGPKTRAAIMEFQRIESDSILKPAGLSRPTGIIYKNTIAKGNLVRGC